MLRHMGLEKHAQQIETAVFKTIAEGKASSPLSLLWSINLSTFLLVYVPESKQLTAWIQKLTGDLGGKAKTYEYAQAICDNL